MTGAKIKNRRRESPRMRKYLTDHEADVLLPHLYGCVEELKIYFDKMLSTCDKHMDDITFGGALLRVVHNDFILNNFRDKIPQPVDAAKSYFSDNKKMLQENYNEYIDKFLERHKDFKDYEKLSDFVRFGNELSFLTSTILDIREKFLLYNLQTWIAKHDPKTDKLIDLIPAEANVVAMPFKVTGENIIGIAETIRKNIANWQKEMMEARAYLLSYKGAKWNSILNILVIGTAVAVSFFFLRIPSFEEKLEYQETIHNLRESRKHDRSEILRLHNTIEDFKQLRIPKVVPQIKKRKKSAQPLI